MVSENKPVLPKAGDKSDQSGKSQTAAAGKVSPKPAKKGWGWLKKVLWLILLAALGYGGWLGWLEYQRQSVQASAGEQRLAAIEQQLAQVQGARNQSEQQHAQSIKELQEQLYTMYLRLNAQGEQLLQLNSASQGDWILTEASYLMRFANQRLQVERRAETALAMLENADAIIAQLDDSQLVPVRRALANDIAALRRVNKIDREGIYLELQAISAEVDQLEILPLPDRAEPAVTEEAAAQTLTWQDRVDRLREKFSQLVVVQQRQQKIEPLLSADEQAVVRQNIALLLDQAQSAVLREEQSIYSASLDKAAGLLERYFLHNEQSDIWVARVKTLQSRSVVAALPDITGSQKALSTLLTVRRQAIARGEQAK